MSKKTLSYKRGFASQRTRWFFSPELEIPAVAACSAPKRPQSSLDRETPLPAHGRGEKRPCPRGAVFPACRRWKRGRSAPGAGGPTGKSADPSPLKRGGPGTGSAKGFRIRAGMPRAAARRTAETIRRRTRRKAEIWKRRFFPRRAAAIDGAKGWTADLRRFSPNFPFRDGNYFLKLMSNTTRRSSVRAFQFNRSFTP